MSGTAAGAAPATVPAVLVLACRRPAFTERLLRFLVEGGARDIFVAVDGPKDAPGDAALVERTREVVRGFDLPASRLLLRQRSLGGPQGVPEAIDWFFGARDRQRQKGDRGSQSSKESELSPAGRQSRTR